MGHHKRFGGWQGDRGHSYSGGMSDPGRPLGRAKPILWAIVIALVAIWSIVAWFAYGLADPLLGWASATNASAGSGFFGGAIAGLIGQAVALLGAATKPAIIAVWAIGFGALVLAPLVLPRIIRLRHRFHH